MGNREQYLRVLLLACEGLGVSPAVFSNLEDCGQAMLHVMHARRLHDESKNADLDAWLSIWDTMQCSAPAGSPSDEPRAAEVTP